MKVNQCPMLESDKTEMENIPYANVVGSLMCAMIRTRFDLAHLVSVISRFMSLPRKKHWNM